MQNSENAVVVMYRWVVAVDARLGLGHQQCIGHRSGKRRLPRQFPAGQGRFSMLFLVFYVEVFEVSLSSYLPASFAYEGVYCRTFQLIQGSFLTY